MSDVGEGLVLDAHVVERLPIDQRIVLAALTGEQEQAVRAALKLWVDVAQRNGYEPIRHWQNFAAELDHSALLARLFSGKPPTRHKPPLDHAYPKYEAAERLDASLAVLDEVEGRDTVVPVPGLCLSCGFTSGRFTLWQRTDGPDDIACWRPSRTGEMDPMIRCPICEFTHTDSDGSPGVFFQGDEEGVTPEEYRVRVAGDYIDAWVATWEELQEEAAGE